MAKTKTQKSPAKKDDKKQPRFVTDNTVLELIVPWKSIDQAFQAVVRKYQPHVKAAGFRKGKVPTNIVIQSIGKTKLYDEALEKALPPAYTEVIKAKKLQPISMPAIKPLTTDEGKDWKFEVQIAERPQIALGNYQKVVKDAVKKFNKENKKKEDPKKEPVKEEKDRQENERKNQQMNAILQALVEKVTPQVPQLLIEQEAQRSLRELDSQLRQMNIDSESYLKSIGKSVETLQQEHLSRALATWQVELLLAAIADQENIEVPEKEIEKVAHAQPGQHLDHGAVHQVLRKQKAIDHLLSLS